MGKYIVPVDFNRSPYQMTLIKKKRCFSSTKRLLNSNAGQVVVDNVVTVILLFSFIRSQRFHCTANGSSWEFTNNFPLKNGYRITSVLFELKNSMGVVNFKGFLLRIFVYLTALISPVCAIKFMMTIMSYYISRRRHCSQTSLSSNRFASYAFES